ncbi:MAG: V-type ATP synthase subunit K [Lentisphaerae bacterium]|nr:V-type ATP synthase subunit K [Lentisphaerota bacterium]
MQKAVVASLGKAGAACALSFSAMGSAAGTGVAGIAAVTAWKKCYAQKRMAPFMLVAFVGAPLTQTIYGMIVMNGILKAVAEGTVMYHNPLLGGLVAGVAIGLSALMQGRVGAGASDALGETGKGFVNYLMALGVIETVALFVMVFITRAVT